MKIKKTKLKCFNLDLGNNDQTINFTTDNEINYEFLDLAILAIDDNKITVGTKTIPQQACDIVIDSTSLLRILTHYVGQEKHTQEELTSLRKKVNAQENQKPLVGIEDVYEEVRKKNEENQKKLDNLEKWHYQLTDQLSMLPKGQTDYPTFELSEKIRAILEGKDI